MAERTYPYPQTDSKVKWVSTEWLADRLSKKDEDLMILDVQPNVHDYIMGHIPGAIYMNEGLLRSAWRGLPAMYVPPQSIEAVMSRAGVDPNRQTLVYSGAGRYSQCAKGLGDGLEQPMMAYSLTRFGHNKVYILDGGIEKWKEDGNALTKVFPECHESRFVPRVQKDYFVEYEEFKKLRERDDVIVFDARPANIYEESRMWPKSGHIPGAISLPWRSLMNQENPRILKSDTELREIVRKHNITEDKTLIIYCGTGREATNEFLIFKWYFGHDKVRVFEGSFTEWAAHPENPTVSGPSPL